MLIDDLMAEFLPDPGNELRQYIDYIVRLKKEGSEEVLVDRSPLLEHYLHSQLAELENLMPENPPKLPGEEFNKVFRTILNLAVAFPRAAGNTSNGLECGFH